MSIYFGNRCLAAGDYISHLINTLSLDAGTIAVIQAMSAIDEVSDDGKSKSAQCIIPAVRYWSPPCLKGPEKEHHITKSLHKGTTGLPHALKP